MGWELYRVKSLILEALGSKGENCTYRISGQGGITLKHLLLSPSGSEQAKYEIYGQPCAANDRFARKHGLVRVDELSPVHGSYV